MSTDVVETRLVGNLKAYWIVRLVYSVDQEKRRGLVSSLIQRFKIFFGFEYVFNFIKHTSSEYFTGKYSQSTDQLTFALDGFEMGSQ